MGEQGTQGSGCHDQESYPGFHYDSHPGRDCCWYALRKIAALPVLRIHCMDYALSVLEGWFPPCRAVRALGCARVGVERVSQHTAQLSDRRWDTGCGCSRRMVGHAERVRGRNEGRHRGRARQGRVGSLLIRIRRRHLPNRRLFFIAILVGGLLDELRGPTVISIPYIPSISFGTYQ